MTRLRPLQLAALATFFVVVGEMALRLKYFVLDSDIWWHLKVGDWIVDHVAVPHTGILSRIAANRPWVAYSWGYEVLLSRAYAWFGLVGIGVFGTLLTLAVAYAIYWMLLRLSGNFWISWLLTWIVCWSFLFNGTPRPFFFSIAFFAVTLTSLLEASRTGRVRALYWLPLIFALWTNIHIQFIYGLFLIGLFAGVDLAERTLQRFGLLPKFIQPPRLPLATLWTVFAACVLATLLGPNFYHPYVVVFEYSKARLAYSMIIELQPLSFRGYSHFLEFFIAAAGFFAVGYQANANQANADQANADPANANVPKPADGAKTIQLDLFKLSLLSIGSVVAFRTMRDAWFICLPAAACVADSCRAWAAGRAHDLDHPVPEETASPQAPVPTETWLERLGLAAVVTICLALVASAVDFNERGLDRAISASYPVNAINYLRHNPVPGPLYNNLNWGGFLMWYMPDYPVAIDGRNDLYGDDLDRIFFNSESAQDSYRTDPYLDEAGVVLLDSKLPLAKVLTIDPRFQLVFHDDIATVFARRTLAQQFPK